LDLFEINVCYLLLNFLLSPASPSSPVPRRRIVVGSGMGATSLYVKLSITVCLLSMPLSEKGSARVSPKDEDENNDYSYG
jgi:hypothetical protein